MSKLRFLLCLPFVLASAAYAANWPERPTLRAVRVAQGPVIDGDLGEAAWQAAPEFTDFTQHDPDDGQPATMRTSVRILYDDEAIYFGMSMADPGRPTGLLARRDSFTQSDFVSINIDPQLDRLSGNAFTVSPVNVQVDTVLYNDIGEDGSWDGVWDSATKITDEGWFAEVRVPFSQLRFPDKPVHVWGLNITRRTVRNNEWVRIVNTRKGETGFVSHFADIVGLEGIHRGRPLELVPYAVARSDVRTRFDRDNPLLERQDHRADGGLDVKYALTSALTLTGTINPDFGQVEVDPAVVNLSDFETFYPERRPFFTEGLNIFRFNDSPAPSHFNFVSAPSLFYTRRIGRAPQVTPDFDYVDSPADATILGAAKITGKLPGGWSIGVLDALTDSEEGRYASDDGLRGRQEVEPMTNYFVSRITKELGEASRVGMLFAAVNRDLSDDSSSLRESAMSGGFDAYTSFADRSWVLEGSLVGSRVKGSAEAIRLTQRSSSRYYQRPDADHVELDPTRTSLDGWAGRAMFSRSTGIWRPNVQLQAYSPGYETNDVGFMQRTDLIAGHALMQYVNPNPTKRFRDRNMWFGTYQTYNFDADAIDRGWFVDAFGTFTNYWEARASIFAGPGSFSDRQTRGGPLVRTASNWALDGRVNSDSRKPFFYGVNGHVERSADGSYSRTAGISLTARPASNIQLSLEPSYSRSYTAHQYVDQFADATAAQTYGRRYVFGELQQHLFELGTRADWTLRSNLSFQLYLQPFLAAGDYENFSSLAEPRTRDYAPYAYDDNPDFNFRSVRGSAVVRWEFRPGSALYVVWNENRAEAINTGDFRFGRDVRAIPNAPSHDVFLVKLSYWLPL
ncbi:MAG TPA: DUF5916 domain-containing protein [Thermoanaerobaculia bacterium]|jgi:hypothetical protein